MGLVPNSDWLASLDKSNNNVMAIAENDII